MKSIRLIVAFIVSTLLLASCGSDSDSEKIGTKKFTFTTSTDIVLPLVKQNYIIISQYNIAPEKQYIIEDDEDLNAINATLNDWDKLSFTDLGVSTYFLIFDGSVSSCQDYYKFSNATFNNNILTIILDIYHDEYVVCPQSMDISYLVFKAAKQL